MRVSKRLSKRFLRERVKQLIYLLLGFLSTFSFVDRSVLQEGGEWSTGAHDLNEVQNFCLVWEKRMFRRERNSKFARIVIFEPLPSTGFANQLRGIISTAFYAALTQRDFYINWTQQSQLFNLSTYLSPNCINWNHFNNSNIDQHLGIRTIKISGSRRGRGHPLISYDFQTKNLNNLHPEHRVIISSNDLYYDNFFHNQYHCRAIREFGFNHPDEVFKILFRFLFKPSQELTSFLNKKFKDYTPMIGLQMRLGGSPSDSNFRDPAFHSNKRGITETKLRNFEDCALLLKKENEIDQAKKARIFVTSDSSEFKRYFRSGEFDIVANDGPVEHTGLSNVSHVGMLKVFADFLILSNCKYIIVSPGTFGVTAALAGGAQHFYSVSNDANTCSTIQCGQNSKYCSFSWSGFGVTLGNDVRTHLSLLQPWKPYIAALQSELKYENKKIVLNKLLDSCD